MNNNGPGILGRKAINNTRPPLRQWSRAASLLPALACGFFIAEMLMRPLLAASSACDPPPPGIVSWWPGDGNANDLLGINNGALEGGATATAAGLVSEAFSFDGANAYVEIPDSTSLKPATFTVEAWVNFSSLNSAGSGGSPAGDQYIVFKQNSQTYNFEGIDLSKTRRAVGDVFRFLVTSASAQTAEIDSATTIATNVWYHLAAVRGSNFMQLYVNGQLQGQTNVAFAQDYGTLPLYFGSSGQSYWDHKLAGSLDEVTLYSRPLASNEIAAIYAAAAAGKCKTAGAAIITVQPLSQTVPEGSNALFAVTAGGAQPLSYHWQFNGAAIPSATSQSLQLTNVQPSEAGSYTVIVTNSLAAVTSSVATLIVTLSESCDPPPVGVISWWPGDGNANDLMGTNNGTLEGGATATAAGLVSEAFSFDGTNGYVLTPDSPSLRPATFTVETWVRFASLDSVGSGGSPAGDQYLVFKQNTQVDNFEGIDVSKTRTAGGDVFRFLVTSASAQTAQINSTTIIATNVWYHVAAVRGSNFTQLYVNGQLQGQQNVAFAQNYGTLPLYFGTSGQSYWDHKLAGNLDEVTLYSRPLASNEIAAIYAARTAGKCKKPTGPVIAAQPQSQTVTDGSSVLFSVSAGGTSPLSYQWKFNGAVIPGATNTTLTLSDVQPAEAGNYTVIVTNSLASVTSMVAVLTVETGLVPPAITTQPVSQTVVAGTSLSFTVTASGTAPLSYLWSFNGANLSGATSTKLTLADVQPANAGSYAVVVGNSAGSVTSAAAVLTVLPAAGTVTINGAVTYQTIDGFGVNANSQSWTNNQLQPVLDALIDQAGMTVFRVIIGNVNWEATNDNGNPDIMNWSYYNTIYNSAGFQKLWGMMAYLNQKGITTGVMPKAGGPVPLWMGGVSLTPGYEDEYAETFASMLVYARSNQHLQFTDVQPANEPDNLYTGVNMTGPAQYVTVLHDLGKQLDNNGMSDVRFSGPDLASTSTSWMAAIMNDSYLMSKLAYFGLHSYQNETADASGVSSFIQQSAYPGTHFWMTEFNVWCQSCNDGTSGDDSWTFARGAAAYLLDLLAEGASAGMVFEAYDSQYAGYDTSTGKDTAPTWSFWGLFAVDDINASPLTYTPRPGFYTLAQIARYVRPGAQRISVSSAPSAMTLLAFYNTNNAQITITGVNSSGSPSSLTCALTALPAIPGLNLIYTSSTTNLANGGYVPVTNGVFAVAIPADCVFTLTYSNAAPAVRPPIVAAPSFLTPTVQNGNVLLSLTVAPGRNCQIQISTDLVHWQTLTNIVSTEGTIGFTDTNASRFPQRFYRAVLTN